MIMFPVRASGFCVMMETNMNESLTLNNTTVLGLRKILQTVFTLKTERKPEKGLTSQTIFKEQRLPD